MKLTKERAIEIAIELWTWLAETGVECKSMWSGWEKYGDMSSDCPLCEYADDDCDACHYYKRFGYCTDDDAPFDKWYLAKTSKDRKKYAKLFLEQLKKL